MSPLKDRRRFQRLNLNIIVTYKRYHSYERHIYLDDTEIEATAIDISAGGLGLMTDCFIPESAILDITLTLSSIDETGEITQLGPILAVGQVRSVVKWKTNSHRIGICFLEMTKEHRVAISNFISKYIHMQEKRIIETEGTSGKKYS